MITTTRTARCLDMGEHDHDASCFERSITVGSLTTVLPPAADRVIAEDRKETEPCQASTVGCCIDHSRDSGDCETW